MAHECSWDGTPAFGLTACYGHLKAAALNGGRGDLTQAELAFVGFTEPQRSEDPWRPLGWLARVHDGLGAEERETFKAILDLPAALPDFL